MVGYLFSGRRWISTILAMLATIAFVGLGIWQTNRLNQRLALNQQIDQQMQAAPVQLDGSPIDPAALSFRRVAVRGVYDPAGEILWRNRSYNGVTGYNVLTPLKLDGSNTGVLVNRGWVPLSVVEGEQRSLYAPPAGEVTVDGVARPSQNEPRAPQDPPLGPDRPRLESWYQITIPNIEQQVGYPLLPVFVELQPAADAPELPVRSATGDLGPGSHLQYALQWYSFAVITVIGYLAIMYQQRTKAPAA